jgi:hypothetical protein
MKGLQRNPERMEKTVARRPGNSDALKQYSTILNQTTPSIKVHLWSKRPKLLLGMFDTHRISCICRIYSSGEIATSIHRRQASATSFVKRLA